MLVLQKFVEHFVLPVLASVLLVVLAGRRVRKLWLRVVLGLALSVVAIAAAWVLVPKNNVEVDTVVAGTIIDASTRESIPRAAVSVLNRPETDISESNGNFVLKLTSKVSVSERVKLHVEKNGYESLDQSVVPGVVDLVIQLRRVNK